MTFRLPNLESSATFTRLNRHTRDLSTIDQITGSETPRSPSDNRNSSQIIRSDTFGRKKVEITPFDLPRKTREDEDLNACDYYYRALELQPSDYSVEVLRQEGVSFIETSQIRTSHMFKGYSLQQLAELKFKDPEEFEKLRKNGYKLQEDTKRNLSCTMI
jgi:SpoVK/Ycf46/Vps4 family AAA+-type ATPase